MKRLFTKRLLCCILVFTLVVCLFAACGEGDTDVYKVGICQYSQHDSLDVSTEAFMNALKEKLGDKIEFDLQNASGDQSICSTIVNQFVVDEVDLIMVNATPALQAAMSVTADIPIVATSITDYATALDMNEWDGITGINVTGTADLAPLNEQAAMIKELIPDGKKVGILYCSAEPNSKYQVERITPEFEKLGYEVEEFTIVDSNDIAAVTTAACDEVDCLYIPTDNTIAIVAASVYEISLPEGVPVICGESGICKNCGIATFTIDYSDLGYETGLMAYDILVNGTDPAQMEIKYATDVSKKCVTERMNEFGIEIPDDYEELVIE